MIQVHQIQFDLNFIDINLQALNEFILNDYYCISNYLNNVTKVLCRVVTSHHIHIGRSI